MDEPGSRRDFLRFAGLTTGASTSLGVAGTTLLAGCGDGDQVGPGNSEHDGPILEALLGREHTLTAAYAATGKVLRGRSLAFAASFADHERRHATALRQAIGDLGRRPEPAMSGAKYQSGFPALADANAALVFAIGLERQAIAAYIEALPELSKGPLRALAASILTSGAEHVSILLDALDKPPVPDAFVTGRRGQ